LPLTYGYKFWLKASFRRKGDVSVYIHISSNNTTIVNCLILWETHILYSATLLPEISGSFVLKERSVLLQLFSQGRMILRLKERL